MGIGEKMRNYKFANYLWARRIEKGFSQFQLGKLLGVSDKAVSKWENGLSKPRPELFPSICKTLEIPFEDFLKNL